MLPAVILQAKVTIDGLNKANSELSAYNKQWTKVAATVEAAGVSIDNTHKKIDSLRAATSTPIVADVRVEVDDRGFEDFAIKKHIAEDPVVTQLTAEVEDKGFEDFGIKKNIARDGVTARLTVEVDGITEAMSELETLRTTAAVPIIQEVRIEVNEDALKSTAGVAGAAAAGRAGGSTGRDTGFAASTLTKDMTQLRQWDRGHPNFFASTGGSDSNDIQKLIQMMQVMSSGKGGTRSSSSGSGLGLDAAQLFTGHAGGSGHRSVLPWWGRLATGGGRLPGAGSLGSFAGFGAEHFALSLGGVLGSGVAAAAGGGLLAAGALGKLAIGGGSDALVSSATIASTKEITEAQTNWNEAIKQYGYYSTQARTAQKNFNEVMREAGPAGEAELKLGEHAKHLEKLFKNETGGARKESAKVLGQVLNVGEAFVPKVAGAAEQNLAIVSKDIKPLFKWLEGPEGMGVFDTLENKFKTDLPTSIHAFSQAIEFVLKTVADASKFTGGFMETLDKFFTKWNEPQNFAIWEEHIENLIEDFHLWMGFLKDIGGLLKDVFSNDAHTGSAIVIALDEMINKADEWVTSTEGSDQLHNIFSIHKEEILALLQIIPPLVTIFRQVYMTVAPPLVHAATAILVVIAEILQAFEETGPLAKWALGIAVIASKMGVLKPFMAAFFADLKKPLLDFVAQLPVIGQFFVAEETAQDKMMVSNEALATSNGQLAASFEAVTAAMSTTEGAAGFDAATGEILTHNKAQMAMDIPETAAAEGSQLSLFATAPRNAPKVAAAAEDASKAAADAEKAAKGGLLAGIAGSNLAATATVAGAVVGGYFAASFATKAVEGITGSNILEGQSLFASLTHGFNTQGVAKTEAKAFSKTFHMEVLKALESDKAGPLKNLGTVRGAGISDNTRKALEQDAEFLGRLKSGFVTDLPQIEKLVKKGSEAIASAFKEGTPEWRLATANNMAAAVQAIEEGEMDGLITAEEGQKAIAKLLHEERVVTGNDPFGIAKGFTKSWEEAGGANRKGIANAMAELGKMPAETKQVTLDMMLQQVKHAEETGKLTKGSYDRMKSAVVADFGVMSVESGREAQALGMNVVNSFGEMNTLVGEALEEIGGNTNSVLQALGAATLPKFNLKGKHLKKGISPSALKAMGGGGGRQTGGIVVPGSGSGDKVPLTAMVEPGEVVHVLNRNASKKLGQLEAINKAVPRFQEGGAFASGGQVVLEAAAVGNTTQGKEPQIMADLKKFSAEMAEIVYVNSAYRTPQHSVEVGGYPDDPHTRGEAADIGLGVPTVASMIGVPEKDLAAIGLYRFAPTSPTEANHVELLNGGPTGEVISVGGGSGKGNLGGISGAIPKIKGLSLNGPSGMMSELGNAALNTVFKAANEYIAKHAASGGGVGGKFTEIQGNNAVEAAGKTLLANGLNKIGASGILGNAWQESGWDPEAVGDGGGGFLGFTAGEISLASLQAKAKEAGKPWTDPSFQMRFALEHISGSIISGLNSQKSPGAAAAYFMNEWEHPLVETENQANREAGAQKAFSMGLQGGGTVAHPIKTIENIVTGMGAKTPGPIVKAEAKVKPVLRTIEGIGIKGKQLDRLAALTTDVEKYGEYASDAEALDHTETAPRKEIEQLEKEGKPTEWLVQGESNGRTDGKWLQSKLGSLLSLRNQLLTAHEVVESKKTYVGKIFTESHKEYEQILKAIRKAEAHKRDVEKKVKEFEAEIKKFESEIRTIENAKNQNTKQLEKEQKGLEHQLTKAEGGKQTAAAHAEEQSLRGQISDKQHAINNTNGASHGSVKALNEKINEANKAIHGDDKAIKGIERDVTRYQRQENTLSEVLPVLEAQKEGLATTAFDIYTSGGSVGNQNFMGLQTVQGLGGPTGKLTHAPAMGEIGGEIFSTEQQLKSINEALHPKIEKTEMTAQEIKELPLKEIEASLALAELTPGKEDDIAALEREKVYDRGRLTEAESTSDFEEITQWAEALRGTEEALTGQSTTSKTAEELLAQQEVINEELRKDMLTLKAESPVMASMRSVSSIANAGAFATGGMVAATVGENGAETLLMPNGSNVVSNAERRSVVSASGRPGINFEKVEFHEAEGRVSGRANGQAFDTEAEVTKVTRKQATTATRSRTPGGVTR